MRRGRPSSRLAVRSRRRQRGGMAYTDDSKSSLRKGMRVRLSPLAPLCFSDMRKNGKRDRSRNITDENGLYGLYARWYGMDDHHHEARANKSVHR